MNQLVRFWTLMLSLAVSVTAMTYLVVSFVFPNQTLAGSGTWIRTTATILSIVGMSVFIWALLFLSPEHETEIPEG